MVSDTVLAQAHKANRQAKFCFLSTLIIDEPESEKKKTVQQVSL